MELNANNLTNSIRKPSPNTIRKKGEKKGTKVPPSVESITCCLYDLPFAPKWKESEQFVCLKH